MAELGNVQDMCIYNLIMKEKVGSQNELWLRARDFDCGDQEKFFLA
jgi:hypothetical protein